MYAYLITNGMLLGTRAKQEALVRSDVDEVLFSVDGADQETYARYRRGGNLARVLANMRGLLEARERLGAHRPYVVWRYILFRWNDSDEQLARARALAAEIGVDRFCFEITTYPEGAPSQRFVPGTPEFERIRYECWGYARYGMRRRFRELRLRPVARCGRPVRVRALIENTGVHTWQASTRHGLRHVTAAAQLLDHQGNLIHRDLARRALPHDVPPGKALRVELDIPPISRPGLYQLQFDMVYEGVAWFGELGNRGEPAVRRRLLVL